MTYQTQRFESTFFFSCPECGHEDDIDIEVPELDFSGEGPSEMASEGTVAFNCPACGYEFSGDCYSSPHSCTINLNDYELELAGDPPMYSPEEDWTTYGLPANPEEVFTAASDCLVDLLNKNITPFGDDQALNRMLHMQFIAAMEAYLSDTLISEVRSDAIVMKRLALGDKSLNEKKYKLQDIVKEEDFLRKCVEEHLRSVVYHNLERVRALYKTALDIDIKPEQSSEIDDWEFLHKAVLHRHDCVHRNGRTDSGERSDVFTNDYILLVSLVIWRLVAHISNQLPSNDPRVAST